MIRAKIPRAAGENAELRDDATEAQMVAARLRSRIQGEFRGDADYGFEDRGRNNGGAEFDDGEGRDAERCHSGVHKSKRNRQGRRACALSGTCRGCEQRAVAGSTGESRVLACMTREI